MAIVGSEKGSAMERFGSGGMALLPWTKQMLTVLWEQLRLLVQVIYYSFMSVFQMFRLEVHLRITDETGQHIQHMTAAASQTDSFLFSSLFDGENGVMVGGSNPLSNFCADVSDPFTGKSPAEALLSSLRGDDLCCGLVDDFVSRTSGKEENIFLGHKSSWKMGFPGDWNFFVSSSDSSNDGCKSYEKVFKKEIPNEEERSSHWSSEEDQSVVEFDSEESKALWESLSRSSDPYNPFFFSACISTNTSMGKNQSEAEGGGGGGGGGADVVSASKAAEELLGPRALNVWVSRSDSESSWSSWSSSDGSSPDMDREENERLLEFFSSPQDPYNPMCFTASTTTTTTPPRTTNTSTTEPHTHAEEKSCTPSSEEDEEEQLWKSLGLRDDPYHPLNFQACLQTTTTTTTTTTTLQSEEDPDSNSPPTTGTKCEKQSEKLQKRRTTKPTLTQRDRKLHCHPEKTTAPWKKHQPGDGKEEREEEKSSSRQKKVRFSPVVHVHVMRTWPFARQASRKGPWEEMARDRDRFRRRVQETEQAIGYCFSRHHRERMRAYVGGLCL